MNTPLKILVSGPVKAGKTVISNYLADLCSVPSSDYRPTIGCRIVEFEREVSGVAGSKKLPPTSKIAVELWDCSGDKKFELCWPAMAKDAAGLVIVYNPDVPGNEKDALFWFKCFGEMTSLTAAQCIAFAHNGTARSGPSSPDAERRLGGVVRLVYTSLDEEGGDTLRREVDQLVVSVFSARLAQRDKEEDFIISAGGG